MGIIIRNICYRIEAILPAAMVIVPMYMERMVQLIGRRCLEHGFSQAMDSVTTHLFRMRQQRAMQCIE